METALEQWGTWIAATPLSLYLQRQGWILIVSQTLHIASVAIVFGSALLISMRLLGIGAQGRRVSELVTTLVPWMYAALVVLLLTGVEQTIAAPLRQFMTWEFRWKMLLVALTTGLTIIFARMVRARAGRWDDALHRPAGSRVFAIAWLGLWIAIVYCGRFIGYAGAV